MLPVPSVDIGALFQQVAYAPEVVHQDGVDQGAVPSSFFPSFRHEKLRSDVNRMALLHPSHHEMNWYTGISKRTPASDQIVCARRSPTITPTTRGKRRAYSRWPPHRRIRPLSDHASR